MILVVFNIIVHILDAVFDEVNGSLTFPVAANPVLASSLLSYTH